MKTIKIKNLEFPCIFAAPGTLGFFGEGYPFHKILKWIPGFTIKGIGFVSKTVTAYAREGNMPFKSDGMTPAELLPKSIWVAWFSGHIINAVSLSNGGIEWAIRQRLWQKRTKPYMISFMSLAPSIEEKKRELEHFYRLVSGLPKIFGIQINFACPNTGQDPVKFLETVIPLLEEARRLFSNTPIIANFNPFVPIEILLEVQEKGLADAFWIANTIPWNTQSKQPHHERMAIDWVEFCPYRHKHPTSPLIERGLEQPGGLSGKQVLPFVIETVKAARAQGISLPIIAGNGIQSTWDAKKVFRAGADGIALGSIFILRPWWIKWILSLG